SPVQPSALNPAVPAALDALTMEMLAKDPQLRPTAEEVVERVRETASGTMPGIPPAPATRRARAHTVGRQADRDALPSAWSAACDGKSSLIAVAGEPGIGKTTLVNDVLSEIVDSGAHCLIGRGRCSETLALTEAYLPVLEALEGLVRSGGEAVQRMLRHLA